MVDFGFGLVPSSRINLDLFDREKFEELAAIEPDVRKCMASAPPSRNSTMAIRTRLSAF